MNQDLVDEIEYMIDLLTKSGFFSQDEILEILEDQFIEYEIDFSEFDISPNDFNTIISLFWRKPLKNYLKKQSFVYTTADMTLKKVLMIFTNCMFI